MKKHLFVLILCFMVTLTGCSFSNEKPKEVLTQFFDAFKQEEYDTMKTYCSENMIQYFNDIDGVKAFFGHKNAELISIEERDSHTIEQFFNLTPSDQLVVYSVTYKGEAAPYSSRTSDETIQLTFLLEYINNEWKINDISTEY